MPSEGSKHSEDSLGETNTFIDIGTDKDDLLLEENRTQHFVCVLVAEKELKLVMLAMNLVKV